jgi:hypothetical protein
MNSLQMLDRVSDRRYYPEYVPAEALAPALAVGRDLVTGAARETDGEPRAPLAGVLPGELFGRQSKEGR